MYILYIVRFMSGKKTNKIYNGDDGLMSSKNVSLCII